MHLANFSAATSCTLWTSPRPWPLSGTPTVYAVTASVDYFDFRNPVNLGDIVMPKSQVNRAFHTSMEVGVEVYSENVLTGERKHTTSAYVTFVAIDEQNRQPKPVPPLILKTPDEKDRFREAGERRKTRLALRYGEKTH
jgi:acyl-CoA hydrolase